VKKSDEPFFDLAAASPFTALIHVYDRVWASDTPWDDVRKPALEGMRGLLMEIIREDSARRKPRIP
jgi:hypothetical protein